MSERRYTLTESQLMEFCSRFVGSGLPTSKLLECITPDPDPSVEMVERRLWADVRFCFQRAKKELVGAPSYPPKAMDRFFDEAGEEMTKRMQSILIAEVTRQVEGQTKVYRDALEMVRNCSINPAHTMTKIGLEECLDACNKVARQALANKGEE